MSCENSVSRKWSFLMFPLDTFWVFHGHLMAINLAPQVVRRDLPRPTCASPFPTLRWRTRPRWPAINWAAISLNWQGWEQNRQIVGLCGMNLTARTRNLMIFAGTFVLFATSLTWVTGSNHWSFPPSRSRASPSGGPKGEYAGLWQHIFELVCTNLVPYREVWLSVTCDSLASHDNVIWCDLTISTHEDCDSFWWPTGDYQNTHRHLYTFRPEQQIQDLYSRMIHAFSDHLDKNMHPCQIAFLHYLLFQLGLRSDDSLPCSSVSVEPMLIPFDAFALFCCKTFREIHINSIELLRCHIHDFEHMQVAILQRCGSILQATILYLKDKTNSAAYYTWSTVFRSLDIASNKNMWCQVVIII